MSLLDRAERARDKQRVEEAEAIEREVRRILSDDTIEVEYDHLGYYVDDVPVRMSVSPPYGLQFKAQAHGRYLWCEFTIENLLERL